MRTVPACGKKRIAGRYRANSNKKHYSSHSARKRRAANSNTLRDAQKRQKTPFRAVKLGIFVRDAHENTSRDVTM